MQYTHTHTHTQTNISHSWVRDNHRNFVLLGMQKKIKQNIGLILLRKDLDTKAYPNSESRYDTKVLKLKQKSF